MNKKQKAITSFRWLIFYFTLTAIVGTALFGFACSFQPEWFISPIIYGAMFIIFFLLAFVFWFIFIYKGK